MDCRRPCVLRARELQNSCILTSGDAERPEKHKPEEPGRPFDPVKSELRDGRIEAFPDWLTAPDNPRFARVTGMGVYLTLADAVLRAGPGNFPTPAKKLGALLA